MDKVKEIDTIIDEIETTTDYIKKIDLINYTKVKIDKETVQNLIFNLFI